MVLARLFEEDTSGGSLYTRILKECLLGQGDSSREACQGKDPIGCFGKIILNCKRGIWEEILCFVPDGRVQWSKGVSDNFVKFTVQDCCQIPRSVVYI